MLVESSEGFPHEGSCFVLSPSAWQVFGNLYIEFDWVSKEHWFLVLESDENAPAVTKQPDREKFAIKHAVEISLWSFLAYYEILTHWLILLPHRTNKRDYEIIKEASVLSWEISFQRSRTSAKWHLLFILLQETASQLTKFMAWM